MNVLIQPSISLFDELSFRLFGWQRLNKEERLDIELKTTKDLTWLFANWQWLLLVIWIIEKGWK